MARTVNGALAIMNAQPGQYSEQDEDLAACQPTQLVKAAGVACMLTGLFTALQSVQLLGFTLSGVVMLVPFVMLILGVAAVAVGFYVMRIRGWASAAGTGLAGFVVLFQSAWIVFGLAHGFVSLVGFGVPPLALAATVLCGLAIPPAFRADLARRRLAADGLSTGM